MRSDTGQQSQSCGHCHLATPGEQPEGFLSLPSAHLAEENIQRSLAAKAQGRSTRRKRHEIPAAVQGLQQHRHGTHEQGMSPSWPAGPSAQHTSPEEREPTRTAKPPLGKPAPPDQPAGILGHTHTIEKYACLVQEYFISFVYLFTFFFL